MYTLDAYKTTDRNKIDQFIENNGFADLVTLQDGSLCSNKVPLYYDKSTNELFGHFGRDNPQLKSLNDSNDVLVIFSGAHAYISPQWYESDNGVPTWNFQTLQIRGKASIVDGKSLLAILAKLTKFYESTLPKQWTMSQLDPVKRKKMTDMITGFKIKISDIKFKEKMSQLRSVGDQKSVVNALNDQGRPFAKKVAKIMKCNLED